MSDSWEDDPRFCWLKSVLIASFAFGDIETVPRFFASNDGHSIDIISKYFCQQFVDSERCFLVFHVTTEQAEIEEEIFTSIGNGVTSPVIDRRLSTPGASSFTSFADKDEDEDSAADDDKSIESEELQLTTRETSVKIIEDSVEVSHGDNNVEAGQQAVQPQKIIIKRTILVTTLHMLYNTFPDASWRNDKSFLFVLRSTCCPVPAKADIDFLNYNDILFLSGNLLTTFIYMTHRVYIPVLESSVQSMKPNLPNEAVAMVPYDCYLSKLDHNEALDDLKDFSHYIDLVVEAHQRMKLLNIDASLSECSSLEQLEALNIAWANRIAEMISVYNTKIQSASTPLDLVLAWTEGQIQLCFMKHEFPKPNLDKANKDSMQAFQRYNMKYQEMMTLLKECQDIVRVVPSLLPHFKIISFEPSLENIKFRIPHLFDLLRVVWSASEYFSNDKFMEILLQKIISHITDRTIQCVDIKSLFRVPLHKLKIAANEGKALLSHWKASYFSIRSQIEQGNCERRWEFDRRLLFEKSDHVANICQDLYDCAELIEEVFHCFVPEIINAFGYNDAILKLQNEAENLLEIVNLVSFDPFKIQYEASWASVMEQLRRECNNVAEKLKEFFDSAFKNAASIEELLDFMSELRKSNCRADVKQHVFKNGSIVATLCIKELDDVHHNIINESYNPGGHWSQPETSVKIRWAKICIIRVTRILDKYNSLPELLNSEFGSSMESKCQYINKEFGQYLQKEYEKWLIKATANLLDLLSVQVLHKNDDGTYTVNFPDQVLEIINECVSLEREGFSLPSSLRNLMLQRTKFTNNRMQLCAIMYTMKANCNRSVWSQEKILKVEALLNQGTKRLNWNCAGLETYIQSLLNMCC